MKLKRIGAFFIDMLFVSIISSFLLLIPVFGYDETKQESILSEYFDKIMNVGSGVLDEEEMITVMHDYSYEGLVSSIVTTTVTFLYFGIYGFISNGNTFGKKIMKIKIVPIEGEYLNPSLFILRETLLLGIIFKILSIINTMVCKDIMNWYNIYNTISYLSAIISFIIYGFIIFRDDERGLHDIIAKTKVISTKENQN